MTQAWSAPDLARYRQKRRNSANKKRGNATEGVVRMRLIALGFLRVEAIQTGWKLIFGPDPRTGRRVPVAWFPIEKVAGDFTAVEPGGRAVLVESKATTEPKLLFSTFEKHQHDALNEHHQAGGIALAAWTHALEVFVMRWPIPGLIPRSSIGLDQARALAFDPTPITPER